MPRRRAARAHWRAGLALALRRAALDRRRAALDRRRAALDRRPAALDRWRAAHRPRLPELACGGAHGQLSAGRAETKPRSSRAG